MTLELKKEIIDFFKNYGWEVKEQTENNLVFIDKLNGRELEMKLKYKNVSIN